MMRWKTPLQSTTLLAALLALASGVLAAQQAPAPAAAQAPAAKSGAAASELEPAVNTSAPVAAQPEVKAPSAPAGAVPSAGAARPAAAASKAGTAPHAAAGTATNAAAGTAAKPAPRPAGKSMDRLELETSQITGNRELPRVMYVVPWRRADLGDLMGRPANSLLDEALTPVDRDVFRRQSQYYQALQPDQAGAAPGPVK